MNRDDISQPEAMEPLSQQSALEERLLRSARRRQRAPRSAPARDGDRKVALPAQSRLFILHQLEPEAERSYRITVALELIGDLDIEGLRRAVAAIVHRHPVLRTVLSLAEGRVWQEVRPAGPEYALRMLDADQSPTLEETLAQVAARPFDLSSGPLMRSTLCRFGPDRHLFVCELHHAVADAWSVPILCAELGAAYAAALRGVPDQAEPLSLPSHVESSADSLAYWIDVLEDAPRTLNLPLDYARPTRRAHHGARIVRTLPGDASNGLLAVGTTAAATALAVVATVLHRWTGDAEVVVGMPLAGRVSLTDQAMIGLYATTLPIRLDFRDDPTFTTVAARAGLRMVDALAHQDVPFDDLVTALGEGGATGGNAVYQVLFAMQNVPDGELVFPGLAVRSVAVPTSGAKLDLAVHVTPGDDGLRLSVEYDADLFETATAAALADQISYGLSSWPATAHERAGDLLLAPAADHTTLVQGCTGPPPAPAPHVVDAISAQAERTPQAPALRIGCDSFSYREVLARADAVAAALGARPREALAAVLLPRGLDLIAAMLGTHRAGIAYIPLEPRWPAARIAAVLDSCRPDVVITGAGLGGDLPPGTDVLDVADLPLRGVLPHAARHCDDDLAYVICTSGSTGTPKNVMVTHGGLANHLAWAADLFAGGDALLHSSVGFDLPVPVLYGPLMRGQTLTLAQESAAEALAGAAELTEGGFGFLKMTPSHLRTLAAEIGWGALARSTAQLMVAGEELRGEMIQPLADIAPDLALLNEYGPSELSVACSAHAGTAASFARCRKVPIGSPLPGTRVYVLDRRLRPVPPGVLGEIYGAGSGLCRGYRFDPRETAERFLPDPFAQTAGARMYRTGDLARMSAGGTVTFAGRGDEQWKIRGMRVEPAEVEATLREHPAVAEAAVVVVGRPTAQIKAYVVVSPTELAVRDLTAFVRHRLPDQLVPSDIAVLDRLPLTGNGKVDRAALREDRAAPDPHQPARAVASTPTERALARLWQNALGGISPQAGDDFFDRGGHSLAAVALVEQIERSFGVACPLSAVFRDRTFADLAVTVERLVRAKVAALSDDAVQAALAEEAGDGLNG